MAGPVSDPKRDAGAGAGTGRSRARRALVVTVSDGVAAGVRQDASGPGLAARLTELGFEVDRAVVPDERPAIGQVLARAAGYVLVITTGGTGLTPRDVTPQATKEVLDYEIPGLAELMRARGARSTPFSYLSRAVSGVRGGCLIVNVPGSPGGALDSLAALEPVLDHALATLAGPFDHDSGPAPGGGRQS
jgi:molybdenum cofactor synthesis domain-containing protein